MSNTSPSRSCVFSWEEEVKEAFKDDRGKRQWDLLPLRALDEVIKVFEYGYQNHPERHPHQWRYGTKFSRYWSAAVRHIFAWWKGEALDQESGLSHLAHAVCDLLILMEMSVLTRFDDRQNWIGENLFLICNHGVSVDMLNNYIEIKCDQPEGHEGNHKYTRVIENKVKL